MALSDLKDLTPEEREDFQKLFLGIFLFPLLLGYFVVKSWVKRNPFILKQISVKKRLLILIEATLTNFTIGSIILFTLSEYIWLEVLFLSILATFECVAIFFVFAESLFKNEINFRLTADLLKNRLTEINRCELELLNPDVAPIGVSYGLEAVCGLKTAFRNQHLMITGGSGLGKTSVAITLIRHDILWNRPVIFIDPKGDQDDIEAIKHYASIYGREDDVLVFSIVNDDNFFYDPLFEGTPNSKSEKILQILNIEHDYYRSVADNLLQLIFTIYDYKGSRISMNDLEGILLSKERLQALFDDAIELLPMIEDRKERRAYYLRSMRLKALNKMKY